MSKLLISSISPRAPLALLLILMFLFTNFALFTTYAEASSVSIPTGSVISGAKDSFIANKGVYSDWGNPSSGFMVDPDYSYRLSETSSTEYVVFGVQSYDDGISVANTKGYLTDNVRRSAIFSVKSNSKNAPGKIGFTATNLKIWNPNKRKYDYLDMKVTVKSWEISNGSNNYIYINKNPKTTIYISDVNEANVSFEYYLAGTSTQYAIKGNLTYADIDNYQYLGFSADKTVRQYVATNSLLDFWVDNGKYVYYRNGPEDSSGTPRLAAGICFETDNLEILFGNNRVSSSGNKWAMFWQHAESMGLMEVPEPYKTVSDSDEEDKSSATLVDVEERFIFRVSQRVPAGMSEDMYYSSFVFQDKIDSCLQIEDVNIVQDFSTDRNDWFTISNLDNNVVATALPEILASNQFYGGNQKDDVVLTMEIECVINPEKSNDDFTAHGHFNFENGTLIFPNIGTVTINDSPASTNEVETRVGEPDLVIEKTTDRYEYQVGEPIEYTIDVYHSDESIANAVDVIVKDVDLPEWIQIDESTVTASGISAPFTIETTTGGIVLNADRISLEERCTISFTGTPSKELNGTIVPNTASVIAYLMFEEKTDDASIYINSPKLNLTKVSDKEKIKAGDIVTYELTLTQINPGTFMRDVYIEDMLPDSGINLHEDSIQVFNSEGDEITEDCDITVSDNHIMIVPFIDMAYEDLKVPPKEAGIDPYDVLTLESMITVKYDLSIVDNYDSGTSLTNVAIAPATENTNGDTVVDDPDIPSGGDDAIHTTGGEIEAKAIEPEKKSPEDMAKTGDFFNPIILAMIIAVSGALLVAVLMLRKKFHV